MANTAWYDRNHSNDPSRLQGRSPDGTFNTDVIGGHEEVETSENDAVNKEYSDFLEELNSKKENKSKLRDFEIQKMKEAFNKGNQESKKIVLKLIKEHGLKYNHFYPTSVTGYSLSGKVIFIDPQCEDYAHAFWHEHWHAIDHLLMNNEGAKQEFEEDFKMIKPELENIYSQYEQKMDKEIREKIVSENDGPVSIIDLGDFQEKLIEMSKKERINYEKVIDKDIQSAVNLLRHYNASDEYFGAFLDYFLILKKKEKELEIKSKVRSDYRSVSDFFSGATNGQKIMSGHGHEDYYWTSDDVLRSELLAHLGSALSRGGNDRESKITGSFGKKYFNKMFKTLIRTMIQEGR